MLYSTRLLVPLLLAEVVGTAVMVAALLSDGFSLVREARETPTTPWGSSQAFFYGVFRRQ